MLPVSAPGQHEPQETPSTFEVGQPLWLREGGNGKFLLSSGEVFEDMIGWSSASMFVPTRIEGRVFVELGGPDQSCSFRKLPEKGPLYGSVFRYCLPRERFFYASELVDDPRLTERCKHRVRFFNYKTVKDAVQGCAMSKDNSVTAHLVRDVVEDSLDLEGTVEQDPERVREIMVAWVREVVPDFSVE